MASLVPPRLPQSLKHREGPRQQLARVLQLTLISQQPRRPHCHERVILPADERAMGDPRVL